MPHSSSPETAPIPQEVIIDEAIPAEVVDLQEYLDRQPGVAGPRPGGYPTDMRRVEEARHDPLRFEALAEQHESMIEAKTSHYFLLGGDQDDLRQEAMFGFFKSVQGYDGVSSSFKKFSELCVERQLVTAVKTATRLKHQALNGAASLDTPYKALEGYDGELFLGKTLADRDPLPEDLVVAKEEFWSLIDFAVSKLTTVEQASLTKVIMEGQDYETVASALNCSEKTVDNALQRARRKLKKHFDTEV